MIKKIDDYLFCKSFSITKRFIKGFCESPSISIIQLIYITGGTSSGKTDLLNVFGTELMLNNSGLKIKKVEANNIINDLLESLNRNGVGDLLSQYFLSDIILIDNYELLNKRPKTTEMIAEFLYKLLKANKKIIISSIDKRGLNSIKGILKDIKIRTIDLNRNVIDLDHILKIKSEQIGLSIKKYNLNSTDLREIEGYLKTAKFSQSFQSEIS